MDPIDRPIPRSGADEPLAARRPFDAARLVELLDNARGMVWIKSLDGRILYANRYVAEMLGRDLADVVGRRQEELFPAADAARYRASDLECVASGDRREHEAEAATVTGRRSFLVTKFPLRDASGRPSAIAAICTDITEQKRAEAELRRNAEQLRLITDALPALVSYVDAGERYRFVNRGYEAWFGRPVAEWPGRSLEEVLGPEAYRAVAGHVRAALGGESVHFECEVPYREGIRRVEARYVPDRAPDGTVSGFFALVTDVSNGRAIEGRLRLQSAALDAAADAVVITDRDGVIEWANRSFTELTGYPLEEATGRNPRELLRSGAQDDEFYDELWGTIGAGRSWHGELVNRRKDGTLYEEAMSITPVPDEDGEVRHFVAVKRDVTERKIAEREMRRFLASSPAVIYALRPQPGGHHRPVWASANLTELTGFPLEETLQPGWWVGQLHPEDAERALAAQLPNDGADHVILEYRLRRADGQYLWIRDEQRMSRDAAGRPLEIVGSWTDVTERVRLEEQFRQSQKMEAIGRLAGGVAHDFNNLLTVILGSSELLAASLPADGAERSLLAEIRDAAGRAGSLTRRLLAFGRQQVLAPRVLALNEVAQGIEGLLRRLIGEDIELVTRLDSAVGAVRIDPGQLEQVIVNLVVNAREAMPRGGRIELSTREIELAPGHARFPECRPGRYAVVAITDNGTGMSPEVRSRIFEPFFTTKEQGTGLGLATVFGIVRQSDGDLEVESAPGAGTRFEIAFPIVPAANGSAGAPARPAEAPPLRGSETILLVEDEEALRKLGRVALERLGFRVLVAGDGREALAVAESAGERIDLLVTDLVMPGMGGHELAELLRRRRPELRVLCMSGYVADSGLREEVAEEIDGFIQKPFQLADLARQVRRVLDRVPAGAALRPAGVAPGTL